MAYKYRNVRITAGFGWLGNGVTLSGTVIPEGYKKHCDDSGDSMKGSVRNNTDITLLCLLDQSRDEKSWRPGWGGIWSEGYPKEGSLSLAPGSSFNYEIFEYANTYRLRFGHTEHPLVNIAGGVWNGYLYEVV